jgi:hypothetical protein
VKERNNLRVCVSVQKTIPIEKKKKMKWKKQKKKKSLHRREERKHS